MFVRLSTKFPFIFKKKKKKKKRQKKKKKQTRFSPVFVQNYQCLAQACIEIVLHFILDYF